MPRVLVVDDEPQVRELLRRALSLWGYEVVEAENGSDALDKYEQALPDIVLMDVAMPVMGGFQALQKLRESPSSNATPVVLVTTHPASEGEPIAMSLGCQHYISKPFDLDVLKSTIKVALRESQASTEDGEDDQSAPANSPSPPFDKGGLGGISSQKGVGGDLTQLPPDDAASGSTVLRTGIELVDDELGGGIPRQSLTLIEGTMGVGKSVLCHHLIYGSLLDNQAVIYISVEETEQSFIARMSSIGMRVSDYIQRGRLQTRCFSEPDLEEDSDRTIAALSQLVSEAPQRHQTIIIDPITNHSIYGQEQAIVALFQLCKDQCKIGQTICVVTHSAILEEKLWLRLRPLLDTHIRLSLKPMGRNLVKTLEVLKLNSTEVHTGSRIAFDVQPGVGIAPTRISGFTGQPR